MHPLVTVDARIDFRAVLRVARDEKRRLDALSEGHGFTGEPLRWWRRQHVHTAAERVRRDALEQFQALLHLEATTERLQVGTDYLEPAERAELNRLRDKSYPIDELGNEQMGRDQMTMQGISDLGRQRAYTAALRRLRAGQGYTQISRQAAE